MGCGPFSQLGQDAFDLYWKYYPKYRSTERHYSSLEEFLEWLPKNIDEVELLHPFDRNDLLQRIRTFNK